MSAPGAIGLSLDHRDLSLLEALERSGFWRRYDVAGQVGCYQQFVHWLDWQHCALTRGYECVHGALLRHPTGPVPWHAVPLHEAWNAIPVCQSCISMGQLHGLDALIWRQVSEQRRVGLTPRQWVMEEEYRWRARWAAAYCARRLGYELLAHVPRGELLRWIHERGLANRLPREIRDEG